MVFLQWKEISMFILLTSAEENHPTTNVSGTNFSRILLNLQPTFILLYRSRKTLLILHSENSLSTIFLPCLPSPSQSSKSSNKLSKVEASVMESFTGTKRPFCPGRQISLHPGTSAATNGLPDDAASKRDFGSPSR